MTTTLAELAKTKEFLAALALMEDGKLSAGMFAFDDLESRLSTKDWSTLQTWLMDGGTEPWKVQDHHQSTKDLTTLQTWLMDSGPEPWKVPETEPRTFTQADTELVASYGDDLLTRYFKQKEGNGTQIPDSTARLLHMMGR